MPPEIIKVSQIIDRILDLLSYLFVLLLIRRILKFEDILENR